MLHVSASLENSLQALQELADDLLAVGRSSQDGIAPRAIAICTPTSEPRSSPAYTPISAPHANSVHTPVSQANANPTHTLVSKAHANLAHTPVRKAHANPAHTPVSEDCSDYQETPFRQRSNSEVEQKVPEATMPDRQLTDSSTTNSVDFLPPAEDNESAADRPTTLDFSSKLEKMNKSSTKNGSNSHLYECRSPMTNLKKLLDRKTHKLSDEQAQEIAEKLFYLEGLEKKEIVKHLLKKDDFSALVAEKYMKMFNFSNVSLDESLRLLLKRLALLGETQEREKVLHQFSSRYKECNPRFLNGNIDLIHVLVCATALLNTDLHGVKTDGFRRMTSKQFLQNLEGISKEPIPVNLLKEIYRAIKKRPLPWCDNTTPQAKSSIGKSMSVHKPSKSQHSSFARSQSVKRFSSRNLPGSEEMRKIGSGRSSKMKTLPKRQGVLWRKAVIESDGNKTVRRRRKWKLLMVALHGLELHLIKKEASDVSKISLHHCLAEVEAPGGATKRQNVFRLTLANKSSALYQANSDEEMKMWMNAINRNAALLSSAPLSAGIGSELKFRRPLMPTACSTLPLAKQLEDQRKRLSSIRVDLEKLLAQSLVGASAAMKEFHQDKREFLKYEESIT